MDPFLEVAFWVAAGLLASTYAAYPVGALASSVIHRSRPAGDPPPLRVSVVIAARPGDPSIGTRVRAALALEYPRDRLEVIVASTRSTGVACSDGDIIVLFEPDVLVHPEALRHLVAAFADPRVGAVCGNRLLLRARGERATLRAERLYSDWEKWIQSLESRSDGLAWPDTAVWAFRREHFGDAPAARSLELGVAANVVAAGRRIVWEPRALSWQVGGDDEHSFAERIRATRRRFATLLQRPGLLNPFRHGSWSLALLSHGPIRWLAPHFLAVAFASSLALSVEHAGYRAAAAAQLGFYALAAAGWLARPTGLARSPLLCVPLFLCLVWISDALALAPPAWRGTRLPSPARDWTTPASPA